MPCLRSEEHTSELQSHSDLHSFPTRRSSDLCRSTRMCLDTQTSFHIRLCKVHCSKCFYKNMYSRRFYRGSCACRDGRSGARWVSNLSVDCNITKQCHV